MANKNVLKLLVVLCIALNFNPVYGADISMSPNMSDEAMDSIRDLQDYDGSMPGVNTQRAANAAAPQTTGKTDFYDYQDESKGVAPPDRKSPETPGSKGKPRQSDEAEAIKEAASDKANDEIVAPLAPQDEQYSGQHQAYPEIQMQAFVSSRDVNRIVCGDEIRDVLFSKEKGVKVKNTGRNLFVKFLYAKSDSGEPMYANKSIEMFVVCGENVFNLILTPKGIPAQTIRLESGKLEKIRKNTALFLGMPFEKKVTSLIKSAYKDELEKSFDIKETDKEVRVYADLKTVIRRTVSIEGEGVKLTELIAIPSRDIELNEKMFNKVEFATRPVAIAVEHLRAKKGKPVRVFIVEKTREESDSSQIPGGF